MQFMVLQELEANQRASMQQLKEAQESGDLPLGLLMEFLTPYHGSMQALTIAERVKTFYPWLINGYSMPIALGITVEKTRHSGKVHLHALPYLLSNLDESSRQRMEENLAGVLNEELGQTSAIPFDISFHNPSGRDPVESLRDIAFRSRCQFLGTIDSFRDIIDEAILNPPSVSKNKLLRSKL